MATLASILDKKACGGDVGINTGKLGCLSLFGAPTHLMLMKKGFKIPVAQAWDLAYISENVQKGNFIPIIDSSSFEDLSAEDAYTTNSSGIKRLNLDGLVELKFMYEEGHEFYKEISKLKSYKSYDVALGDDNGNWMFSVNSDGTTSGFSLGHVTPERRTFKVKGGDSESKSILMQFIDRLQYDRNYGISHIDELGFTPQEIATVNGVDLDFLAVPAALDTTFDITAVLSSDRNTKVEGLLLPNFVVLVNGADPSATVLENTPGVYTFTVPALAVSDIISVDLWDGNYNSHVAIDAGGVLFRSVIETETVLA